MTNKELFLHCAEDAGIKVADYTVTKVQDYVQVVKFFGALTDNGVKLGMDMASLTCSGDVEVTGAQPRHIRLIEKDNGCHDYFKFKGMVMLNGDLNDPESSPEIFIEADEDIEWLQEYAQDGYPYVVECRYLGLEMESEGKFIYDKKRIEEYFDIEEESYYDSEIIVPLVKRVVRNTKREMLVYLNVQECVKRHSGSSIIYKARNYTCDDLINAFSDRYKEI